MKRAKFHVTPVPEGWRVLDDAGRRVSELFLDREAALSRAEGLARSYGEATLYVHGRGGLDSMRLDFGRASRAPSRSSFWPPRGA